VLAFCFIVGLILTNAVLLGGLDTSHLTQTIIGKIFILLTLSSLLFHWLSGLRHLIIDWWPAANQQVPQAWFRGWAVSLVFIFWAVGSLLLALALFFGGRG
jgi:succinate dehydrogenase / fumarate reductase cytochrome b subunit